MPITVADKTLARLARLDGQKNGESVAQVGDLLRQTMQTHCGVFRFADMLKQGVVKINEIAERVAHTEIHDKSRVFNTARVEALELDNLIEVALASMVSLRDVKKVAELMRAMISRYEMMISGLNTLYISVKISD